MQFFLSVLSETLDHANSDEMASIDDFNDLLKAGGHWVHAAGLSAPDAATVIDGRGEKPVFTHGPFLVSDEHIAGFWILEAPDLARALTLAAAGSKACNRRVEVRPLLVP